MLTTTHYGLNIVEGTDVVNPLVQQNPNYTAIDAAMFANKQGSIGSGTELTSGTVHTITRANPDSNYVRFTSTSNWTAGDSMVVDSTPVSVYLSDGTTPATGAYVINTEVLILVNGSRVTLLASGKQTATQTPYDNTGSGLSATNVKDAIDEVNGGGTLPRTITQHVAAAGYVSGSGNYFICTIPLRNKVASASAISVIDVTNGNVFLQDGGVLYNAFEVSGSSVTYRYDDYIIVELRLSSTQTANRIATGVFDLTLTLT